MEIARRYEHRYFLADQVTGAGASNDAATKMELREHTQIRSTDGLDHRCTWYCAGSDREHLWQLEL
jgi:hypothetical protein